jgi:apolipoprotein N-acyltransferase
VNPRWRVSLAVAAGLVGWTAFPPLGVWPLSLLSVTMFVYALRAGGPRPDGRRVWRGAGLGLVYGLAFFLPLLSWLHVLGLDALIALALLEAAFFAAYGAAFAAVSRLAGWPVWAALLWAGQELARGALPFGGFPWGRLAYAQAGSPLGHLAPYGTAALVTVAVALAGALIAAVLPDPPPPLDWRKASLRPIAGHRGAQVAAGIGAIAIIALPAALPVGIARDADDPRTPVPVAIVQGNVPGEGMDALGEARTVTLNHLAATEHYADEVAAGTAPAADFVLWPENSTDIDPLRDAETRAIVDRAVAAVGVPILVGAILDEPGPQWRETAGVVWDPVTGPGATYVKRHPVPFGEYIPFRQQLLPLIGRLEMVGRDTFAGSTPGVLDIAHSTIGDVICFEVAYDGIVRDVVDGGGQVLVVQTNNATYGGTAQPEQQFEISRVRALEFGRTVLVASTNGISGVIGPGGAVEQRTSQGTQAVLTATFLPATGRTMAARLGPWPERAFALGGLVPLGIVIVRARRRHAVSRRQEEAEAVA